MPTIDTALIVLAGIALFAAFVNGAIGYGFSSLTVPVALLFYTNRILNPAIVVIEVFINFYVLFINRNGVPAVLKRRSEEHTSELQSRLHLVCRLLLEKKKNDYNMFLVHTICCREKLTYSFNPRNERDNIRGQDDTKATLAQSVPTLFSTHHSPQLTG